MITKERGKEREKKPVERNFVRQRSSTSKFVKTISGLGRCEEK